MHRPPAKYRLSQRLRTVEGLLTKRGLSLWYRLVPRTMRSPADGWLRRALSSSRSYCTEAACVIKLITRLLANSWLRSERMKMNFIARSLSTIHEMWSEKTPRPMISWMVLTHWVMGAFATIATNRSPSSTKEATPPMSKESPPTSICVIYLPFGIWGK